MRVRVSAGSKPFELVEVLEDHQIVPPFVLAEVHQLIISQTHSAAVNHAVLKRENWVVKVHFVSGWIYKCFPIWVPVWQFHSVEGSLDIVALAVLVCSFKGKPIKVVIEQVNRVCGAVLLWNLSYLLLSNQDRTSFLVTGRATNSMSCLCWRLWLRLVLQIRQRCLDLKRADWCGTSTTRGLSVNQIYSDFCDREWVCGFFIKVKLVVCF